MKTFRLSAAGIMAMLMLCLISVQHLAAQTYTVDTIPYRPYAYTGGHTILVRQDDIFSQSIPLGFNFTFYGNSYTQILIGANGHLSFNVSNAGTYDQWMLDGSALPSATLPTNSIFPAYRDIDNTNIGTVSYQLQGTAPNRIFVASWDSIPLYGSIHSVNSVACRDSSLSTFQVALYEGCNTIEVYIHHSPSDTGWNAGRGIIGIVDAAGTNAVTVPGHNDVAWTENDKAWSFNLSGTSPCIRSSAGQDQTICVNYPATMQATGTGTWSASPSNPAPVTIVDPSDPHTIVSGLTAIGGYLMTWATPVDTSHVFLYVAACSDSVWPGDADFNGLVNNDDLLPIGLGYDSTGPARPVQGIVWSAAAGIPWAQDFAGYTPPVNYRYADCNGDGTIDGGDMSAIYANYSLLHFKTNGPAPHRNNIPTLYAQASVDSLHPGDSLIVHFMLADATIPATDIYGISFTYNFDPALVDSTATSMSYASSWLGSSDKISLTKILHSSGEIQTAVTRITHTGLSGYGVIGSASFRVRPGLSSQTLSTLVNSGYISDIHAVTPASTPLSFNTGADTTYIAVSPLGMRDISAATVSLRPNPAHDRVTISADAAISEVSVSDAMGQKVMQSTAVNDHTLTINTAAYSSGIYFVQVKTSNGNTGVSKLVVERGE